MNPLRQRMIEDMRLVGLSDGTQRVYVDAVRSLARRYRWSPEELTQEQVRAYFLELSRRELAPSTVRVRLFAFKFLYLNTLQRDWSLLKLYRIKKSRQLPAVLSRTEDQLVVEPGPELVDPGDAWLTIDPASVSAACDPGGA